MAELNDCMPVIRAESDWPKWLGEVPATEEELSVLLTPRSDDAREIWKVDRRVGNLRNNGPELALPA